MYRHSVYATKIFDGETVSAGSSATSAAVNLKNLEGYFSLSVEVSGDGTCKFEYLLSDDGSTFYEPSGASDIASSITKSSGPGSDGKDKFSFDPQLAMQMKVRITETGSTNSVTVTAKLVMQ
jgi:hypothetical protein